MTGTAPRVLVPFVHVASVQRSIDFYTRLGFVLDNTFVPPAESEPSWAWLQSEGARIMFARATEPVVPSQQAVLFYVYCDDVAAKHAELTGMDLPSGSIATPFYAPRGEFKVVDPDGYVLMFTHT